MDAQDELKTNRAETLSNSNNMPITPDLPTTASPPEKQHVTLSPSIYSNYTKKNLKAMESIHAKDAERATCMQFCRDTITRIADKGHLQRAHIETLLSERVSNPHI